MIAQPLCLNRKPSDVLSPKPRWYMAIWLVSLSQTLPPMITLTQIQHLNQVVHGHGHLSISLSQTLSPIVTLSQIQQSIYNCRNPVLSHQTQTQKPTTTQTTTSTACSQSFHIMAETPVQPLEKLLQWVFVTNHGFAIAVNGCCPCKEEIWR